VKEYFAPDAIVEDPVGFPPRKSHPEIADTSHWGKIRHFSVKVIEAVRTVECDTLAAFLMCSVHFNDSHAHFPAIALMTWSGTKVATLRTYFDPLGIRQNGVLGKTQWRT